MSESISTVDVIIITYYTGDILFKCIESTLQLKGLNKIIIIDNGNTTETVGKITELGETHLQITLITGQGNIGFSKGCNLGASLATAEFLLFLNPDCITTDYLLLQKLSTALINYDYKVATCKILNSDGTIQKTCRRNLLTPRIALSESLNLYKFSSKFESLNRATSEIDQLIEISPVLALSGALIFASKSYYESIKGLDEEYFLHVEDMDFCMKVHQFGDKIAFVKDAVVTHMLSTSSNTTNKFLEHHKAKGFIIYMIKYFPIFKQLLPRTILKSLIYLRYFIKVYLI